MGVLTDTDIRRRIEEGGLVVEPFDEERVQPASLELCLGADAVVLKGGEVIDARNPEAVNGEPVVFGDDEPLILEPRTLVLAHSLEHVELPEDLMGWFEGKSSLARTGLLVHVSAGLIHPGSRGKQTFELYNLNTVPIQLYEGMPLAQIVFEETTTAAEKPYYARDSSRYVDQEQPET